MKSLKKTLIFISIILVVIASVGIDHSIKSSITKTYNKQAQLELQHMNTCFNQATGSITEKLNKCASNSLVGGRTGDVFAVNLKDMKIIWDNSVDCKTSETMYLTKDSVCKLASNPGSCEKLSKQIKLGYNGNYSWFFDDSKEYDNWIVLPNEIHNFDGSSRAVAGIKDQIVLVQGFQTDEVMEDFKLPLILNKVFSTIIILLLSILLLFIDKKDKYE